MSDVLITLDNYNIIKLSVGFAIGSSGKSLIFSLVEDVIIPMISKIFRIKGKHTILDLSEFLSNLVSFLFVMAIVYVILFNYDKYVKKKKEEDVQILPGII